MKSVCFVLKADADMEIAWQELENLGIQVLYSDEEIDGNKKIYGLLPSDQSENLKTLPNSIAETLESPLPAINWEDQWREHGNDFREGFVHLSLQDFGFKGPIPAHWRELKLVPGPGFGDLSHPTTSLVLEMMPRHVPGNAVIDAGCGSGILSLAAAAMGAASIIGLEIDQMALEHARKNAELNGMAHHIRFYLPHEQPEIKEPVVLLINMISSEQRVAWDSLKKIDPLILTVLSSGIPKKERSGYLELTREWGLKLEYEREKNGWLGFCFSRR